MPQYIPGPEAILGPAFTQLAQGLSDFLQPQKKFRDAALVSIMQDPTVVQKFADLEATQPGFLQRIGLAGLAGQPSVEAQFAAENRPDLVALKKGALDLEKAKLGIQGEITKSMASLIRDPNIDPQVRIDMARRGLGLETQAKARQEAAQATTLEAQAAAAGPKSEAEQAQAKLEKGITEIQQKLFETGGNVSFQDLLGEKFSAAEQMALFASPVGKGVLETARIQNERDRITWQQLGDDESIRRLKLDQAFKTFQAVGVPAPLKLYERALEGAGADLVNKDPATLTPEQRQLVDIQRGLAALEPARKDALRNSIRDDIRATISAFDVTLTKPELDGKKGDAQRALITQQLSGLLQRDAKLNGTPAYTASFEEVERPGFNKKELVIRDANKNVRTLEEAIAGAPALPPVQVTPPKAAPPKASLKTAPPKTTPAPKAAPPPAPSTTNYDFDRMRAAYDRLSPGEKQAQAAKWISQAKTDADKNAIRQALGITGSR